MTISSKKARLILIPLPLSSDSIETIPTYVLQNVLPLRHFIVENERTARRFLRALGYKVDFDEVSLYLLNKNTDRLEMQSFLEPLKSGYDVGLMSEAGCPGIADPGSEIVNMAHALNIEVNPLVGPSSILLALISSGMNGQQFCFNGYLPINSSERIAKLKELERNVHQKRTTQLFIETPYRNNSMFEDMIKHLQDSTYVCIASNITSKEQFIKTRTVKEWRAHIPDLHKIPAVFIIGNC